MDPKQINELLRAAGLSQTCDGSTPPIRWPDLSGERIAEIRKSLTGAYLAEKLTWWTERDDGEYQRTALTVAELMLLLDEYEQRGNHGV